MILPLERKKYIKHEYTVSFNYTYILDLIELCKNDVLKYQVILRTITKVHLTL